MSKSNAHCRIDSGHCFLRERRLGQWLGWDRGQVRVPYLGHVPDPCPNPLSQPSHVKGLCPASIFRSVLCGRHFIFFQKNLIKVTLVVIADKLHYVVNTVAC